MRIVFFGTPVFINPVLEALEANFEVVKIIRSADQLSVEELKKLVPDLFVVAAYGKIIPQAILDIPKYGSLNVHPSLLPKLRGASPIQAAILSGEKETGITIIKMDKQMDHGKVIYQETLAVSDLDTLESLSDKLFKKAAEVLVNLIPDFIAGKVKEKEQDHNQATFCKIITKEDGYFEIDNPPGNLAKIIRAYHPWPNVWTKWQGKVVKFLPGGLVQMEGKKPAPLKNFLNGYPDFPIKSIYL